MPSRTLKHFDHPAPKNEEEFQQFMEAMDRHFIEVGMPIVARQLAAVAEVGHVLGLGSTRVPTETSPREGSYAGDDLVIRAIVWYDNRYGDAQKIDFQLGRGVVVLRGDRWEIKYPIITGRVGFCAGDRPDSPRVIYENDGRYRRVEANSTVWSDSALAKVDVLELMAGLPSGLKASLHKAELKAYCMYSAGTGFTCMP